MRLLNAWSEEGEAPGTEAMVVLLGPTQGELSSPDEALSHVLARHGETPIPPYLFLDIHAVHAQNDQQFACHLTSAVDTDHMTKIFGLVGDMVLNASLDSSGF